MDSYNQYKQLGKPIDYLMDCWVRSWSSNPTEKEEYSWAYAELLDDTQEQPEKAWHCILYAVENPSWNEYLLGCLAAGPLEDILSYHGEQFIERVEEEAKKNSKFAWLLGGVWRFQMSDEIWERVQKVWDRRGWDGIPYDA